MLSGVKNARDRKLVRLLKKMKTGDVLIVSDFSRLGRNLLQIMSMLNFCMERDLKIISIKETYELGDNLNTKVLACKSYEEVVGVVSKYIHYYNNERPQWALKKMTPAK